MLLGLQLVDQPAHVARGAAVVLVAGALRVDVLIEPRHVDDADAEFLVAALDRAHFLLRGLRLQRDLVAGEFERLLRRAGRGAGRQHLQAHLRARLAANQLHHVVEAPADHVGERAFLALADAGDAVVATSVPATAAGPPSMTFMMVT